MIAGQHKGPDPTITPAEHMELMKSGKIKHDKASVKMIRSNYGPGAFTIVRITEFSEQFFIYQVEPNKRQYRLANELRAWISGPCAFETSKAAIDDAHERHGVFIKEHMD